MSKPSEAVVTAATTLNLDVEYLAGVLSALRMANDEYLEMKKASNGNWRYLFSVSVDPIYPNQPNKDGSYDV